jgi:amino acid transporter
MFLYLISLTTAGLGSGGASLAFGWFQNLSTLAGLVAWAVMCFTYIRFHAAVKAQGLDRSTFPMKSKFQPFLAWWGFLGASVIALITGFPVFLKGHWNTSDFIASYIGIPIFFVPLFAWKFMKKTRVSPVKTNYVACADKVQWVRPSEADLWAGRILEGEIVDAPGPTSRSGRLVEKII